MSLLSTAAEHAKPLQAPNEQAGADCIASRHRCEVGQHVHRSNVRTKRPPERKQEHIRDTVLQPQRDEGSNGHPKCCDLHAVVLQAKRYELEALPLANRSARDQGVNSQVMVSPRRNSKKACLHLPSLADVQVSPLRLGTAGSRRGASPVQRTLPGVVFAVAAW
jgi:hypothetical protein